MSRNWTHTGTLAAGVLCACLTGVVRSEELTIQTFHRPGHLVFNALNAATNYRMEWALLPEGPWTNGWAPLAQIPETQAGSVTCSVPMHFRVISSVAAAGPAIDLAGALAFRRVPVGETATRTMTILNRGSADLTVSDIQYPEGFSGNWTGTIHAGWSRDVPVTFAPVAMKEYGGTVTVTSDSVWGASTLAVTGTGEGLEYLVVDLSAGPSAGSYPLTHLRTVPVGGWTDAYKTDRLVMRKIRAGTFTMGSPADELGRTANELQHTVELTRSFYIGVFEVTQWQWELVMGTRPSYFDNTEHYATRPVEQVSYYVIRENPNNTDDPDVDWPANSNVTANSFMGLMRQKTGLTTLDLPTEAQWEYACRAGTTTALNNGTNLTSTQDCPNMAEVGRYRFNGGYEGYGYPACTPSTGTAIVGAYQPNEWGLYDMHGNALEWCLDWFTTYPEGKTVDPVGGLIGYSGSVRVRRGGYWYSSAAICRSARRHFMGTPDSGNLYVGLRVTVTLP